mmetsp:Transcript_64605/g.185838  ORF Transcript_64605/g.185838 Transcript_64605/m.185838 type:complete len:452 (+) Transcript_64605:113-1468(+)
MRRLNVRGERRSSVSSQPPLPRPPRGVDFADIESWEDEDEGTPGRKDVVACGTAPGACFAGTASVGIADGAVSTTHVVPATVAAVPQVVTGGMLAVGAGMLVTAMANMFDVVEWKGNPATEGRTPQEQRAAPRPRRLTSATSPKQRKRKDQPVRFSFLTHGQARTSRADAPVPVVPPPDLDELDATPRDEPLLSREPRAPSVGHAQFEAVLHPPRRVPTVVTASGAQIDPAEVRRIVQEMLAEGSVPAGRRDVGLQVDTQAPSEDDLSWDPTFAEQAESFSFADLAENYFPVLLPLRACCSSGLARQKAQQVSTKYEVRIPVVPECIACAGAGAACGAACSIPVGQAALSGATAIPACVATAPHACALGACAAGACVGAACASHACRHQQWIQHASRKLHQEAMAAESYPNGCPPSSPTGVCLPSRAGSHGVGVHGTDAAARLYGRRLSSL